MLSTVPAKRHRRGIPRSLLFTSADGPDSLLGVGKSDPDAVFRRRLGEVLQYLRRKMVTADGGRMTQEAAGELLDTDGDTVGRWERGQNAPSISMLEKIAEVYQIPDDELYLLIRPPAVGLVASDRPRVAPEKKAVAERAGERAGQRSSVEQ